MLLRYLETNYRLYNYVKLITKYKHTITKAPRKKFFFFFGERGETKNKF